MRSSAYTAVLSHAYLALVVCTNEETRVGKGHAPSASEMSVETAQKRAYASNCWNVLLRMREQRRATDFIANMATLARTDTLVMVSLKVLNVFTNIGCVTINSTEGSGKRGPMRAPTPYDEFLSNSFWA